MRELDVIPQRPHRAHDRLVLVRGHGQVQLQHQPLQLVDLPTQKPPSKQTPCKLHTVHGISESMHDSRYLPVRPDDRDVRVVVEGRSLPIERLAVELGDPRALRRPEGSPDLNQK